MCYDGGQACLFIGKLWIQLNRNYSFSLQSTPATTEEGRGEEGGEGGHCGPSWRGARRERRARTCRRSWLPARWSDARWEGRLSWPAVWRTWASTSSCGNKTAELYQVRSVSSFSSSDNNWSFHISAGSLLVRKDARIRLSVTDTEFSLYLSALTLEVKRERERDWRDLTDYITLSGRQWVHLWSGHHGQTNQHHSQTGGPGGSPGPV